MTLSRHSSLALVVLFIGLVVAFNMVFVVDQTEQAIVVEFGQIKRVVKDPGLKFKAPFIQSVTYFDRRLLEFNAPPTEMITVDRERNIRERVVIDAYVKYRIVDPIQFYKAIGNEQGLQGRFSRILLSSLRSTIGEVSLREMLSGRRTAIMQAVRDEVNKKASKEVVAAPAPGAKPDPDAPAPGEDRGFGIEVVDVRIMRADLPVEISQSTFKRMQAGFAKEAQTFRSQGEQQSLMIRSTADRERAVLLATARKNAEITRGEGDGEANRLYAEAYGKDPVFFDFYRSMQAYRQVFDKRDSTAVLSPESPFLHYLEKE